MVTMSRAVILSLSSQTIQAHDIGEALGHALVRRAVAIVVRISLMARSTRVCQVVSIRVGRQLNNEVRTRL